MPAPDLQNIADLLYGAAQPAIQVQPDAVSGVGAPAPQGIIDPWAQDAAAAMAPVSLAPPSAADPFAALPVEGGKLKVGMGESGYSPDKMAQIEAGPMGTSKMASKKQTLEGKIADRWATVKQGQQAANAEQLATEEQLGAAESEYLRAKGEASNRIASTITAHAKDIENLSHDAMLAKQKAADDYRQKLLEIGEVNPNALWDDAGTTGQIGIAAAAVLHEMLNVKGIKTSAMDTINNAIRNKIDAQIANINKQKAVASGFKDLYDMTVAESASQMEVKTKLQGYYLKAMENQIDATLAPYDSNVARLKRSQAKAIIRQAQIKNMAEVESHIGREIDQAYGREITMRGQNIQASIAKQNREAELEVAKIRAGAEKKAADVPPVIYDITKSGKGQAKWRLKAWVTNDKELARNVTNKTVSTTQAMEGLAELMDLQKQAGTTAPDKLGRLREEIQRREQALRDSIVMALVLDQSGKQVTDKEREYIQKLVPANDWFTNGNNRQIISQLIASKGKELNNLLRQTADDIKPGDAEYGTSSAQNVFGDAELTAANLIKDGGENVQPGAWDGLIKQARSPDGLEVKIGSDKEFKEYAKPLWDAYRKENPDGKVVIPPAAKFGFEKNPTKAFDAVREIASHAVSDPSAMEQLKQLASELDAQGDVTADANVKSYAKWFLNKIEGPEETYQAGGTTYIKQREALGN